jgi:hypothetical protein
VAIEVTACCNPRPAPRDVEIPSRSSGKPDSIFFNLLLSNINGKPPPIEMIVSGTNMDIRNESVTISKRPGIPIAIFTPRDLSL